MGEDASFSDKCMKIDCCWMCFMPAILGKRSLKTSALLSINDLNREMAESIWNKSLQCISLECCKNSKKGEYQYELHIEIKQNWTFRCIELLDLECRGYTTLDNDISVIKKPGREWLWHGQGLLIKPENFSP